MIKTKPTVYRLSVQPLPFDRLLSRPGLSRTRKGAA